MSAQSYIKLWTTEPSEHEEVQAYDLLCYAYYFHKLATQKGQVTGIMHGGKIRVTNAGFPPEELLEWMFSSKILKDGEVMNSSGIPGAPKEVIRFRGARCLDLRVHSTVKESFTSLFIHFREMETGDSCYLNFR
mgnify:FL=1